MSEKLGFDENNLCTTEDDFEQFQAMSMYEENEYILLSDILPTQHQDTGNVEKDEIKSIDTEIMMLSNIDDNQYVNSSELRTQDDKLNLQEFSSNNYNPNQQTTKNRKIITSYEYNDNITTNDNYLNDQNNDEPRENIQNIQNLINNSQVLTSVKKRNTKSKIVTKQKSANQQLTNKGSRNSTLKQPVIKTNTKRKYNKKGRPKKKSINKTTLNNTESNLDNTESSEINSVEVNISSESIINKSLLVTSSKRQRKERYPDSADFCVKIDTEIIKPMTDTSKNNKLTILPKDIKSRKPHRGVGRPKKKLNEVMTKIIITEPKHQLSAHDIKSSDVNDFDNEDEVCLRKLSKSDKTSEQISVNTTSSINIDVDLQCSIPNIYKLSKNIGNKHQNITVINLRSGNDTKNSVHGLSTNVIQVEDEGKDIIYHNKLNETNKIPDTNKSNEEIKIPPKRNSKMAIMSDFEYNIDSIVADSVFNDEADSYDKKSPLDEDGSKRPVRKKAKKPYNYDEGSDEDPFANVELSDDETLTKKKSGYYSDDEYIPDGKKGKNVSTESSDSDTNVMDDENKRLKRKKTIKKSDNSSPKKRGRKSNTEKCIDTKILEDRNDVEKCLEPSLITKDESKSQSSTWGSLNEFENFLAKRIQGTNLKIKKLSSTENTDNVITPLKIPMIDPKEQIKTLETSSQTNPVITNVAEVQTSTRYDIPLKENVVLSSKQSEKACEFLKNIVKTTAELGKLMTHKSDDFIKKKINTENLIDTFKMDYCVKKTFLLLKLAKNNLTEIEDNLAQQYDLFLQKNQLTHCRKEPLKLMPTVKDSDSDCEIIEGPIIPTEPQNKSQPLQKVNPKTVFLNKELSIKIAKKPNEEKKLNIKGKHTVWINDSVMVKKVKPTQSFLAQDSRNKKPPDLEYVTLKMVSDFFDKYNHQKMMSVCAQFTSHEWLNVNKSCICNYSVIIPDINGGDNQNLAIVEEITGHNTAHIETVSDRNSEEIDATKITIVGTKISNPETLFTICCQALQNYMYVKNYDLIASNKDFANYKLSCEKLTNQPETLIQLSLKAVSQIYLFPVVNGVSGKEIVSSCTTPPSLKKLCHNKIITLFFQREILNQYDTDDCDCAYKNISEEINNEHKILEKVSVIYSDIPDENNGIKSLFSICVNLLNKIFQNCNDYNELSSCGKDMFCSVGNTSEDSPNSIILSPKSLKYITYKNMLHLLNIDKNKKQKMFFCDQDLVISAYPSKKPNEISQYCINSICEEDMFCIVENISQESPNSMILLPKSLKYITYKNILRLLNIEKNNKQKMFSCDQDPVISAYPSKKPDEISQYCINSINTLSEEAFLNLKTVSVGLENAESYGDDSFVDNHEFEDNIHDAEQDDLLVNRNWVPQLQMKELKPCITPITENCDNAKISAVAALFKDQTTAQVKLEVIEEITRTTADVSIVKTEPGLDEMTIISDNFLPKIEPSENPDVNDRFGWDCNSSSYDANAFEDFLSSNKLMSSQNIFKNGQVFSQTVLRVSGVHEPDYDSILDNFDSLLVPQTYKALHVENAKNILMESDSDEDVVSNTKVGKKKIDKRKVKRKAVNSTTNNKNVNSIEIEKSQSNNVVATMTTRLRDKIRQKEKKLASSDSENESDLSINIKKSEDTKNCKPQQTVQAFDSEIQCNNIDSTEKNTEILRTSLNKHGIFNNLIPCDETEVIDKISSNKIVTDTREKIEKCNESHSDINYDEPVELIECEPTIHIFDDIVDNKSGKKSKKCIESQAPSKSVKANNQNKINEDNIGNTNFIERNGWKCYKIDSNDNKLFANVKILLEKLPETFVETYIQYQDIMKTHGDDLEIERLTNLNSIKRSTRDNKSNVNKHRKPVTDNDKIKSTSEAINVEAVDCEPENFNEFVPSDDEDTKVDNQSLSPMSLKTPENNMAKDSLMKDNDSDDGITLNELKQEMEQFEETGCSKRKQKHKPKVDLTEIMKTEVMLTADRVMNEELTLLNGPVSFNNDVYIELSKDPDTKKKQKSLSKPYTTSDRVKGEKEEDYSSEEEKRWFTTKEKLLKNMDKKVNASMNEAKRAKLVNEFIVKRGDKNRKQKNIKCRRSRKKLLEEQKQLSVLYKDLYGETLDPESCSQRYGKAQRNIGKGNGKKYKKSKSELDNPILFEESERTKRLKARQAELRKLLGCEENETVQVIDDKVCLEYDFETRMAVVNVHEFFTRVMKEHQYAGVKFMWDACFESLANIERGDPGSGCILAHCMGLGKTLQVLALLHTVMTHPRVQMKRVLVCCPLSTVLNWVDEIHKWIGPVTDQIKVFELSKLKKTYQRAYQLEDWYKGGGIFIIGYELFRSLSTVDPLLDDVRPNIINKIRTALLDPGPDIIVCDEGHLLKNDGSILTMAMSRVVTKRRIVLTGTPLQNNLREYYCMVNYIKPNLLGTYAQFYKRFESPIINGQHRDSTEEDTRLMTKCTYVLRKVLEGCLQRHEVSVMYPYLKKKNEYTVFVTLTKCQSDMYKHYMCNYANKTTLNQNILKDFHILQKIWSHPQVLHNFQTKSVANRARLQAEKYDGDFALEDLAADMKPTEAESWWLQYLDDSDMLDSIESSNKFLAVFRILEECVEIENKVLIFSTSLFTLDSLEYFLKKVNNWNLGQEYYRLDGSVPAEVRQKWCREFNAENNHITKLFLISTRAGSLGLNMTAANRVIILDTSWNPAHDIQSIFRVYRFGQQRDCYIYRLVAMGTMEQKIYERSVTKQAVARRVLDEQLIDRHYNSADLNELYLYDDTGMSVAAGVSVGVDDAVVLRVARDAPIHAVHEHDSLLRGSSEEGLPEHECAAAWSKFQQEHAHKQMKDENSKLLKQPKGLRSNMLETVALEQLPNGINNTEFNSYIPPPSRGRKAHLNCRIPIKKDIEEPGPSQPPLTVLRNKDIEDLMVKKISTILMKHNYYREGENKITQLICKVRNIITRGSTSALENDDDELSKSIADILLQKEMSSEPVPVPVTDIMCQSINNTLSAAPSSEDCEGKKRKIESSDEECSILPDVVYESVTNSYTERKKRKVNTVIQNIHQTPKSGDTKRRSKRFESLPEQNSNYPCNLQTETNSQLISIMCDDDNKTKKININEIEEQNDQKYDNNKKRKINVVEEQLVPNLQNNNLNHKGQDTVYNDTGRKIRIPVLPERPCDTETNRQSIDLTDALENAYDIGKKKRKIAPVVETDTNDDVIDLTEKSDSSNSVKRVAKKSTVTTKIKKETYRQKQSDENKNDDLFITNYAQAPQDNIRRNQREKNETNLFITNDTQAPKDNNRRKQRDKNETNDLFITSDTQAPKDNNHRRKQREKIETNDLYITSDTQSPKEKSKTSDEERVPLHPSILQNENFIKIVAHKYLKDNPTMSQEVGILAARHNIKKTLELCVAGNKIYNGDIYEKAVEVLGIDMLKELHKMSAARESASVKKFSASNTTIKVKNTTMKTLHGNAANTSKEKFKNVAKTDSVKIPATTADLAQQDGNNVVPVGLFKGPANMTSAESLQSGVDNSFQIIDIPECILPNDEDMDVVINVSERPSTNITQRYSEPSTSSRKKYSKEVKETIVIDAPGTRALTTASFKVTSEPIRTSTITQPFVEVNMPVYSRKVDKPKSSVKNMSAHVSKTPPIKKPAPTKIQNKDADVVVLSDDEESPLASQPAVLPSTACVPDLGPVPVAIMSANNLHTIPLTVIQAKQTSSKTQTKSNNLSLVVLAKKKPGSTVQKNPVSQVTPCSILVKDTKSSSSPKALPKLAPKPSPHRVITPHKIPNPAETSQTDRQNLILPTTSTSDSSNASSSASVLKQDLQLPNRTQSLFKNIVHIEASNYPSSTVKKKEIPVLKQNNTQAYNRQNSAVLTKDKDIPSKSNISYKVIKNGTIVKLLTKTEQQKQTKTQRPSSSIIDLTDEPSTSTVKIVRNNTKKPSTGSSYSAQLKSNNKDRSGSLLDNIIFKRIDKPK